MYPPQFKKPRRCIDDTTRDDGRLRCDRCKNPLSGDNDYIRNNPCNHCVCLSCFVKSNMSRVTNPACCQVADCHQKYAIISCQIYNRGIPGEIIENDTFAAELGIDEVAWILSFLPLRTIMCLRRVNMTWREAAKKTVVPTSNNYYFRVGGLKSYNTMRVMTRALPYLQQIELVKFRVRHKYSDGEDPDEEQAARTAHKVSHDIGIISNFSKLRELALWHADLNGRYPALFNFPLLQKLSIQNCYHLKWDLDMLAGFPVLKELDCGDNQNLAGNISSLRVLKNSLEKVILNCCHNVEGNFMDLADFPHLKELFLAGTTVTGDIRDISENDFSSLEQQLTLPESVLGAYGCKMQRISDGPGLAAAVYLLHKQRPTLLDDDGMMSWYGRLSIDSPDWYDTERDDVPFDIFLVQAGSRVGYRWESKDSKQACEVNWLDPEPDRESNDYEAYIEELQMMDRMVFKYRGFHQPPTEEEYNGLPLFRLQRAPR